MTLYADILFTCIWNLVKTINYHFIYQWHCVYTEKRYLLKCVFSSWRCCTVVCEIISVADVRFSPPHLQDRFYDIAVYPSAWDPTLRGPQIVWLYFGFCVKAVCSYMLTVSLHYQFMDFRQGGPVSLSLRLRQNLRYTHRLTLNSVSCSNLRGSMCKYEYSGE